MNKTKKFHLGNALQLMNNTQRKRCLELFAHPRGMLLLTKRGKANGRGAYLSKNVEAIIQAKKRKYSIKI